VLVVILTITWSLVRMSAGSIDQATQGEKSATAQAPIRASLDLPLEPGAVGASIENEVVHTKTELSAPPSSARMGWIMLSGVVKDTNGKSIVRYDEFRDPKDDSVDSSPLYSVHLDPNLHEPFDEYGSYSFVELKPGRRRVDVRIPGYRPWHQEIELSRDDRNHRLDIALEPRHVLRLRVVVELESDAPAPESLRQITGDADPAALTLSCAVLHDPPKERLGCGKDCEVEQNLDLAAGEKEGPGAPGTWIVRKALELRGDPPVFAALVIGDRVLRWKRIDSTDDEVVFSVKAAEIRQNLGGVRLHVLDEQGQELTRRCTCRLLRPEGWGGNPRFGTISKLALDESSARYPGEIQFRGLHPGPIVVRIGVPGYATLDVETAVESGTERDLGEFRMKEALSIRGRVVDADGSAVSGHLHLIPADAAGENPSAPLLPREDVTADANGRFAFDDLGRGRYFVQAHSSHGFTPASMPVLVSIEADSVEDLEIRLVPCATVKIEIRRPPGPAVTVKLQDSQGQFAGEKWLQGSDDGESAWFFLVPGGYTAHAFTKGEEIASKEFVLRGENVNVVLSPP
jgi:protocatechuate 3,4-dioxygenase beta subunit